MNWAIKVIGSNESLCLWGRNTSFWFEYITVPKGQHAKPGRKWYTGINTRLAQWLSVNPNIKPGWKVRQTSGIHKPSLQFCNWLSGYGCRASGAKCDSGAVAAANYQPRQHTAIKNATPRVCWANLSNYIVVTYEKTQHYPEGMLSELDLCR